VKTTDLNDKYPDVVQIPEPMFGDFGGNVMFSGQIATVKTFEDNTHVRGMLETPGNGRVLVVDGGGSMRCALLGDLLAQLAIDNGWAGVVINGCLRDSETISEMPVGVKALGVHPRKSLKKNYGWTEIPVTFGGVTFTPGHYLYADMDGIVVSPTALTL